MYRHEEVTVRSTAYNDRLVSSTPVLTAEERHKRQQLQRREAELQHELAQLKERYELLQVSCCGFTLLKRLFLYLPSAVHVFIAQRLGL